MGDVVNLRLARKAAKRASAERTAEENRRRHGATRAEKAIAKAEEARNRRTLEGARRDGGNDPQS